MAPRTCAIRRAGRCPCYSSVPDGLDNPLLALLVVIVVVPVPMWFPFSTRVLVVAAISVRVAYPTSLLPVYPLVIVFRVPPAIVPVPVAGDTNTMITIGIAAFVSVSQRRRREERRWQSQAHGCGEKYRLRAAQHVFSPHSQLLC